MCPSSSLPIRKCWRRRFDVDFRTPGGNASQHPFHADVLVDFRPAYALASAEDLKMTPLFGSRGGKAPGPGEGHAHNATVHQPESDGVFADGNLRDTRQHAGLDLHDLPASTQARSS